MKSKRLVPIFGVVLLLATCKPEKFTTNSADKLSFNYDTILFDTILTQLYIGTPKSVNRQFLVKNPHDKKIKTTITLASGGQSQFRLNVDGDPGTHFENVEIRAGDSIFVFVEAYANPNYDPKGNALIVRDSIVFETNGNLQDVKLIAWGQDAIYHFKDSTIGNTIWADKTKPYVIYDFFRIKEGATLTIKPGVKIYFSPYSSIENWGTLKIEGTVNEPVIMEGDRTSDRNSDKYSAFKYANIPGQWFGIKYLWPSKDNTILHARIKNGSVGVYVDSSSSNSSPNVSIEKSFIQNMTYSAVYGIRSNIVIENSVLANCGSACLYTYKGGQYDLRHVTISGYTDFGSGTNPALAVTNRLRDGFGRIIETYPGLVFNFYNSIVWGDEVNEFYFDIDGTRLTNPDDFAPLSSVIKSDNSFFAQSILKNAVNLDPKLKDPKKFQFSLDTLSAAKDFGNPLVGIPDDFTDKLRDSKPDAGAFERFE